MGLADYENILARLYTEQSFRQDFFNNRIAALEGLQLSEQTQKSLNELKKEEVEFFATGLINKRWGVVKGLIPLSVLGKENIFADFRTYALNTPLSGLHHKHYHDALAFSNVLLAQENCSAKIKSMLRYEQLMIKSLFNTHLFLYCRLNYSVEYLKSAKDIENLKPESSLLILYRFSTKAKWKFFRIG